MSVIGNSITLGGGGGMSPNDAVIHIIARVGSTVTLSKNSVVVKVLDSSKGHVNAGNSHLADYYYSVSSGNFGTWEVASDSYPATKQVTITTNQVYDVGMAVLYLYDHGTYTDLYTATNIVSNATVSDDEEWIYIYGTAGRVQDGYKRWEAVDLTYFNTITTKRSAYSSGNTSKGRYCAIFIADASSVVNTRLASIVTNPLVETDYGVVTEVALDISNVTGTYYVAVGIDTDGSSWNLSRRELIHEVKLS